MNIERKAFEGEYCKVQMITDKGDTFEQRPNGDYVRHSLQLAWLMWQASTQRQGYKLVPVEPTEKMQKYGNRLALSDKGYRYDCASIYEAMIGAVDE